MASCPLVLKSRPFLPFSLPPFPSFLLHLVPSYNPLSWVISHIHQAAVHISVKTRLERAARYSSSSTISLFFCRESNTELWQALCISLSPPPLSLGVKNHVLVTGESLHWTLSWIESVCNMFFICQIILSVNTSWMYQVKSFAYFKKDSFIEIIHICP